MAPSVPCVYWRFLICYEVLTDVLARPLLPVTETDKLHASCFGALFSFQSLFRRWTHSAERTAFPIPSQFPFAAEIEFGRGRQNRRKAFAEKGRNGRGECEWMKGENVWRPFPLVPPPSSQPSLRFVCRPTHGGLITRAADLKLSVPLSQPTNRPAAFGRSKRS